MHSVLVQQVVVAYAAWSRYFLHEAAVATASAIVGMDPLSEVIAAVL
jgi:hypothetical protein